MERYHNLLKRWVLVRLGRASLGLLLVSAAPAAQINPPAGPYMYPQPADFAQSSTFTAGDRVVLTSYFYWYDAYSGAHLTNPDGSDALTDHPPTLTGFSYTSAAWHRQQLLDMIEAGIDVLLPVYWGEPSQRLAGRPVSEQPWSFSGLPPLVAARAELLAQGKSPPRIGMFYDTSTLQYNAAGRRIDLTTDYGRQWFYESIRDFFSLVPPRDWAMIEGKPIIFLYAAGFAADHDQSCIDYVKQAFPREFGGREPYIVREVSWNVTADNTYAWGGAISLKNPGVAALGPGYDHSAVPGREPLVVPRENGAFFERNWTRFLRNPSRLVHVETWNEYHEATDIAASREYGRQYLELNRKYVDLFKAGIKPPRPRGPYSDVKSVEVTLAATNQAHGLIQFEQADGVTSPTEAGDEPCRETVRTAYSGRYFYFRLDDSFKWADRMLVDAEVGYFDEGSGRFRIEYDGSDTNAPFNGAYTASRTAATLGNTRQWKTAKFRLLEARFLNSQNGGADFRIAVQADRLRVRRVAVTRLGLPEEAGMSLPGWQQDFGAPLGSEWTSQGGGAAIRQGNGFVRLEPGFDPPGRLLFRGLPDPIGDVEILTRVRVAEPASQAALLGGVELAADPTAGVGFGGQFRADPVGGNAIELRGDGLPPGVVASFAWQPNTWYWLRLRHEPRTIPGYPDVRVRLWPADGETPEPAAWLAWWDYTPASRVRQGFPGLVAGEKGPALECDYFLVKADNAPQTGVRLPALPPARPVLVPVGLSATTGMVMDLRGSPATTYVVESSPDLAVWREAIVVTDDGGNVRYRDAASSDGSRCFYRARTSIR